ncbi:MAG: hypothetical protein ACI8QZ_001150 [Chlamydiales bacterium]|jgi:hypothetical protein
MSKLISILSVVLSASSAFALSGGSNTWTRGKVDFASIGPITFGPDGVLFVADPMGAALFALDFETERGAAHQIQVDDFGGQLAALLGTAEDQLLVHDLAVSPVDGRAYLSVSRGLGDDSVPVIVGVTAGGGLEVVDLADVRFARAELSNAPESTTGPGLDPRTQSITDLAFTDGRVLVAGLSNEEFASKLRSVPYPFGSVEGGASVEIYHGNHGVLETRAPVRTFLPYTLGSESQLLAAYTCTPLVRFPIADLRDGEKVRGTTVAELGARNTPLDMVAYEKDGKSWVLIANSSLGLMRIEGKQILDADAIESPVQGTAGVGFEVVDYLPGVEQLTKLDDDYVVVLIDDPDGGGSMLLTIENP